MTSLSDLTAAFEATERRAAPRQPVGAPEGGGARAGRVAITGAAMALFSAAAGLWVFPSADHAVMLVKLGASLGLFGAGAVLLAALSAPAGPARVEIDIGRDEIRTYDRERGQTYLTGRYDLRSLPEVSLRNGTFFARDTGRQLLVSVPVRGRARERAIRRALSLG